MMKLETFINRILPILFSSWLASLLTMVSTNAGGPGEGGEVKTPRPNVLLICVDDLRPELNCFGKDYIASPNIDALAARGRAFHRHYVQAPTCGASRYTLLTGTYGPASNQALFHRAQKRSQSARDTEAVNRPSLPRWFRDHGYTSVSVGKVSHHPGGRGGPNWDDDGIIEMPEAWDRHLMPCGPWLHPRGAMHGLANGEIRTDATRMDVFQSADNPDSLYPDRLITDEAISQLRKLSEDDTRPFFLAVGLIRPHLPFGSPGQSMRAYKEVTLPPIEHPNKPAWKSTWHASGEFMKYNRWDRDPNNDPNFADAVRRHYAACVTYADSLVGEIADAVARFDVADNTVIVLWGDHGWHLGERAIWGKHALFEESLRSPLIIVQPGMLAAGKPTDAVVETLDVYPTLCDLAGIPRPDFLHGRSLISILEHPTSEGHPAVSYTGRAQTIRDEQYRLIRHRGDQSIELYDFQTNPSVNLAGSGSSTIDQAIYDRLMRQLDQRLSLRDQP